jgi:hypothetical protein
MLTPQQVQFYAANNPDVLSAANAQAAQQFAPGTPEFANATQNFISNHWSGNGVNEAGRVDPFGNVVGQQQQPAPSSTTPDVGNYLHSVSPAPQQPAYTGPTLTDISGVMTPRFDTLDQGQQGILGNQAVLQQDIGAVGTGVGNINASLGTPANGQTVFGDLGNLGTQVGGLMTNFDQFGNDLSSFRGAFDTNVNKTATTLNDIEQQGLSGRQEINRALQDQQPMIYRTDAAVSGMAANPMFSGGAGLMAPMSAPATSTMTADTNAGLNAAAQTQNVAMGPMGPMAVDPRDMV